MMLMIIAALIVIGLCLGSFVNALVWRVHEQEHEQAKKKPNKQYLTDLSITKGRSMCPHCKHELATKDLLPVISWVSVGGKCRYCRKPISAQYPLVELLVPVLFVVSYVAWPLPVHGSQLVALALWLLLVVGLVALTVYDLRWYLLPDRIMYPLSLIAGLFAGVQLGNSSEPAQQLLSLLLAIVIGGGIFYALFQISGGKWIGGGDVKLGWLLGLIAGTPGRAALFIFMAAILGTAISLPLLSTKRLKPTSVIPFGPFLIAGAFAMVLWGATILNWYQHQILSL